MLTLNRWAESFQPGRRPWLLLGKGPTFDRLPQVDRSGYFVLALNHVVREVECTVAHAIDLDVVVTCAEAIEKNAQFLVVPYRPHVAFDPGPRTVFDLQDEVPVLGRLARAGRLVYYDLSSAPPSGASPRIEARFFSAEAALELLAVCGVREVRSLGVDGGTRYSGAFEDLSGTTRLANSHDSFDRQFEQIAAVLRRREVLFAPWGVEAPARVYVAADPTQRLPARVLEWSLRRHASVSFTVEPGVPPPGAHALALRADQLIAGDLVRGWVEGRDPAGWLVDFRDEPPWRTRAHPRADQWYRALREGLAERFVDERLLDEEAAAGHVSSALASWTGRSPSPPGRAVARARAVLANVRRSRTWRRLAGSIALSPDYGQELMTEPAVRAYPFRREAAKPGFARARARFETERGLYADSPAGPLVARLVVLLRGAPGPELERTLRLWELQTCPRRDAVVLARDGQSAAARCWLAARPAAMRVSVEEAPAEGVEDATFLVFARAGDGPHPSLATTLDRIGNGRGADLVAWHAQGPGTVPAAWELLTTPEREPFTLWNTPLPPRAFAVRAGWARRYPGDLARAVEVAGGQALLLWASRQEGLRWATHPEFLTAYAAREVATTAEATPVAAEVAAHLAAVRDVTCEPARGPLPWRVSPRPRAARASVVVLFRDDAERTRAALTSVLDQETLVPCELVLVAHRTRPAVREELTAFLAERGVARERVRWVTYGGPFNHSLECDLGAQAASGDVLLFLNNDARLLDRRALQAFVDWSLLDGVGTVGCRLVARSGALIGAGVRVLQGRPFPWSPPVEESRQPAHASAVREVVANSFACAAIARATWQAVGPLDAVWFPAGYNDVEFGLRLRRRDLRHLYLGDLACEHEPGGSRPLTDELPQILELWRRYPELTQLGQAQLGTEVISAARVFLLHAREGLRSRVPIVLRTAATKLLRELRGG